MKLELEVKFHEMVEKLCRNRGVLLINSFFRFQPRAHVYVRLNVAISARLLAEASFFMDMERVRTNQRSRRNMIKMD